MGMGLDARCDGLRCAMALSESHQAGLWAKSPPDLSSIITRPAEKSSAFPYSLLTTCPRQVVAPIPLPLSRCQRSFAQTAVTDARAALVGAMRPGGLRRVAALN